ncbi:MAG: CBS domain-containing protein [Candidatus Desulfatibia sp.]|uniref:CBS domain-containing protein n=1 Tax=Candidatus Desulfatibia sp. TaxID=3101189 RepID=UPI002F2C7C1C
MEQKIEDMLVKDLMTYGVITVPETDTVTEVIQVLVEGHVHGVAVISEKNEPIGIISEIDIVKAFGKDFNEVTAKDIMSGHVESVDMNMTIKDAATVMKEKEFTRLLVVDDKKVLRGILSLTDIVNEIMEIVRRKG